MLFHVALAHGQKFWGAKEFLGLTLLILPVLTTTAITILGQAAAGQAAAEPSLAVTLFPFFLIFMVFYFLMWRPQAKRQQEHRSFLNALKSGDEVITAGGIVGTVRGIDGQIVTLEISKGTKVKFLKSQVRGTRDDLVKNSVEEASK